MSGTLTPPERMTEFDPEKAWRAWQSLYGLLTGQTDWEANVHLLGDLTVDGALSIGSTTTLTDLVVTQNTILGDNAADTVTVNATSTFAANVTMNGGLTVVGAAAFGNLSASGNVTLGDAAGDVLTVNATSTMQSPVTNNSTLHQVGAATLDSTLAVTGAITGSSTVQGTQLISTVTTGTAPLTVASTTKVTNLNVDLLDGLTATDFIDTSSTAQTKAGNLTLGGTLTFSTAATKIIPGATSITFRDNTDANSNVTITNAGAVTIRNGLTLSAASLTFGEAVSRIIPGTTSLALRNNANSSDNLLMTDAGAVTTRSTLTVTAGGLIVTAGGLTVSSGTTALQAATATTFQATTYLASGPTPATTGAVRVPSNDGVYGRNAANSANLQMLVTDGSNNLSLGDTTGFTDVYILTPGTLTLYGGGANVRFQSNATGWAVMGSAPNAKQTITGVRTGTLAQLQTVVTNMLSALANHGVWTDSTT